MGQDADADTALGGQPITGKQAWRQHLRRVRQALPPAALTAAAAALADHLRPRLAGADRIAAYLPMGPEPGSRHLLAAVRAAGADLLLPVVRPDGELDWASYGGPIDDPVSSDADSAPRASPNTASPDRARADWTRADGTSADGTGAGSTSAGGKSLDRTSPGLGSRETDSQDGDRPDADSRVRTGAGLVAARWGLLEPAGPRLGPAALATADIVLVPALAADLGGARLGRGGGHYDRALRLVRPDTPLVALLHDGELVDRLPTDPWDRPVTAAVTPSSGWTNLPVMEHHVS